MRLPLSIASTFFGSWQVRDLFWAGKDIGLSISVVAVIL
jgi:hypothetical protein